MATCLLVPKGQCFNMLSYQYRNYHYKDMAFVPGRGTTDAIFIIRQLQEKFLSRKDLNDKNLTLFFAFVDLEKAFDRVPRKVLWWAMRKVGVEEWIVRLVQAMYNNARSQVRVGCEYSEEFEVGVGVHQGSVLSPLLFIIVLEALSRDFRVGVPWELFFADDLVIIATSLEECVERVKAWKEGLESKGLHVNMTKTKFMASGLGLDILQDSGKFPCAVCRTGVGRSSIRCSKCNLWVHYKKCSGLKTLSEDLSYECPRCRGVPGIRPVDGRPFKEVEVGECVLEAVDRFCYLGDMLSAGGGCMAAATARCRCAWGKFRENLPLLTSKPVPFDLRGRLFSSNVRSSMLHGTETWPMTSAALHRLCRNDRAMIRWICGVKPSDDPSMDELHAKLGICDLAILVRERRLRWFGHVMRSNGEINRVRSRPVPGRKGPGRPKKTWEECVKQDLKVCGLSEAGTQDRLSWRSSVKNSRQEPTPSNGSLLQSMAAPPARRVLGMRTRSFNKTGFDWLIDWLVSKKWVTTGPGHGLLTVRHQAITWISAGSLSIRPSGTNFSEIVAATTKIFFSKKMNLRMLFANCWPFCPGINMKEWYYRPNILINGCSLCCVFPSKWFLSLLCIFLLFQQYLFADKSVDFTLQAVRRLGFTKVLCVGAPRWVAGISTHWGWDKIHVPPLCKQHFQMCFLEWKCVNCAEDHTEVCSWWSN